MTAYKAASASGHTKQWVLYFLSILQGYVCLLFVLPNIDAYQVITIPAILMICIPMVKLCWKFIISSVLKFHFNAFTWDHLFPNVACVALLLLQNHIHWFLAPLSILITFTISAVHLVFFANGTINQIAHYLRINVFTIKPKPYTELTNGVQITH